MTTGDIIAIIVIAVSGYALAIFLLIQLNIESKKWSDIVDKINRQKDNTNK